MDFDENYLDELLKSIEPIVGPSEDDAEESGSKDDIPDMPEEELDSDIAEPLEDEPEEVAEPEPAPEPEPEPAPVEEPAPEPEPVAEPELATEAEDAPLKLTIDDLDPADGNKQLSADEIAALFGSANAAAEAASGDAGAEEPADDGGDAEPDISADIPEEPMEIDLDSPELSSLLDDIDAEEPAEGSDSSDISLESLLDESDSEEDAAAEPIEIDLSDEDAITDSLMGEGPSLSDLLAESSDGDEASEAADEIPIGEEQVLSPEEIDAMLDAAQLGGTEEAEEAVSEGTSDDELMSLLAEAGDVDLEDIQHILNSDENGEALDSAALEAATTVEDVASDVLDTPEEAAAKAKEAKKAAKEAKKAAKKAKKSKKGASEEGAEGVAEGEEGEEPKQGFFAKLLGILTEAVDDEEEGTGSGEGAEAAAGDAEGEPSEVANISDENKEIMEELDAEKGKKKGKKGKKKKKGKGGEAEGEGAEGGEGEEDEGSGKKKKKERKKKEKAPKAEEVPTKPEKRLPKKRVRATFILCFSIMAGIIILTTVMTKITNLEEARHAYENQDYQTAYEDLYGLELKGDDADIYAKSQIMLMLDRKLRSYQNYKKLGMDDRAVDALFEGVKMYPDLIMQAESYGVVPQVDYTYSQILAALGEYGISEDEAKEIAGYESKVKYTKRIDSIVHGTPFTYDEDIAAEDAAAGSVAAPAAEQPEGQQVEDILPPETDFLPDDPNRIFDEGTPGQPPAEGEMPEPVTDEGDV